MNAKMKIHSCQISLPQRKIKACSHLKILCLFNLSVAIFIKLRSHFAFLYGLQRSSSLTIAERICTAFIPFVAVVEIIVFAFSSCFYRPQRKKSQCGFKDLPGLADETNCKFLSL